MAKVNLCGVQPLDFETKEGDIIKGIKLHITYQDENVMGYASDTKFLSDNACRNLGLSLDTLSPFIGEVIEIETNIKGKITGVHSA